MEGVPLEGTLGRVWVTAAKGSKGGRRVVLLEEHVKTHELYSMIYRIHGKDQCEVSGQPGRELFDLDHGELIDPAILNPSNDQIEVIEDYSGFRFY